MIEVKGFKKIRKSYKKDKTQRKVQRMGVVDTKTETLTKPQVGGGSFPPYTSKLLLQSFIISLVPPIVLIGAVVSKNLTWLFYTHVMSGALWTGFDLFMPLIMGRVLRLLDTSGRVEVVKRLTPATFFILPSLAATTIVAGIYLAMTLQIFNLTNIWIVFALAIVTILGIQGFVILMPNSLRIFIELAKEQPNRERIVKLNGLNIRLSGIQGALQIAIIFVMVNLTFYGSQSPEKSIAILFLSLVIFAVVFLVVYLLIYKSAHSAYTKGELDKGAINTLNFGLFGNILIFVLLGIAILLG